MGENGSITAEIHVPEEVLADPRLIKEGGMMFWFCLQGQDIARIAHGYDPTDLDVHETGLDQTLRVLWIAHLPFNPDMAFETFSTKIKWLPFSQTMRLAEKLREQQIPPDSVVKGAEGN